MTLDELTTRMFNLRADLAATNLVVDALCGSMTPEAHAALLAAWTTLRAAHEETARTSGQAQEIRATTAAANQRMEDRLRHAPKALLQLRARH